LLTHHPFIDLVQKMNVGNLLSVKTGIPRSKIKARFTHLEHHLAHAAAAFYHSPFFQSAILTLDGIGEMDSGMMAVGIGNRIEPLHRFAFPDSVGLFYRAITVQLGFHMDGDEGKVMGLSAWGDERFVKDFKELYQLTKEGFTLNRGYFNTLYFPTESKKLTFVSQLFEQKFGGAREKNEEVTEIHMALARALQTSVEEIICHLAKLTLEKTGMDALCLAGGVALNSCANGEILKIPNLKHLYIQPAAADDGSALGAALHVSIVQNGAKRITQPTLPYYGLDVKDSLDPELLRGLNINIVETQQPQTWLSEQLQGGKIVGVCRGKAEFGPRALGNRSILADPSLASHKDKLNQIIKKREWFRPFAPIVIKEKAHLYFENCQHSPHMLLVFSVIKELQHKLAAITHCDGTARVQTLEEVDNPWLYQLLQEYEKNSGIPVLLNTSFNGPGKPLVNTAEDALRTFMTTEIDILVLDKLILAKNQDKIS
jgi:carbamoyltransferase